MDIYFGQKNFRTHITTYFYIYISLYLLLIMVLLLFNCFLHSKEINFFLSERRHVFFFLSIFFPKKWDFCPNSQKCFFPRECSVFQNIIYNFVIENFFWDRKSPTFAKRTFLKCPFLKY